MKNFFKNIWTTITKNPTVGGRLLLILLVIAILVIAILLSGPKPKDYTPIPPTPTPVPTGLTSPAVTATRLPSLQKCKPRCHCRSHDHCICYHHWNNDRDGFQKKR